ncbi:MAG: signal recognition particle-docking protein FtsY [Methanobacteriota archaeon]|nr:MAG: signal recognition particle-docking protein FtsY [Euryarchaeota archaeon TMED103]OUV39337.1 MAG: signal recognition particle-docking protein FtsY [Euryarchaeota archaeon TMED103]RAH11171.1 MAG: signal recognition particle-docking protein FtsY [Euryarchaeota archaeon]RAH11834.1 MAG: signal recognition particle-docking protein FtsY [Euryarchaeota archaeon]|tara:strand:- start:1363 stop:2721 length:1359 start_codon:yes stop_codon:yes gene_type:complete
MGLFDRFKKRVKEVAEEVDSEALTAVEDSEEGIAAIETSRYIEEDWEEETFEEEFEEPTPSESQDEDWDDWDDEEDDIELPVVVSKKERKRLEKLEKQRAKELKRRKATTIAKPKGSRVDLSMMRTTTGRQLVEVKSTPRGSSKTADMETEAGAVSIDLGGGIVNQGGRVIKQGKVLDDLLEELEWMLLESDISSEAVTSVLDALRKSLIGARLRRGAELAKVLEAALKRALRNLLSAGYWDFDASIQSFLDQGDSPVVVMLVGVNGTGKTTTAAKIAHRLQSNGHSVIAAAGDTFRAGAIQQLESHCENLGIRCISSQRGGDAAAIARDAIESAKAKNIDVVLVDTAGRMQNKTNLMKELEKVRRVANPHLVLFVGDALAGNDAVDQAKMFQEMMRFDGAVLSKMDTDAKGGAGLSIAFATGRPIVFAGIGQGYDDLLQFDPDWLLDEMFS